MNNNDRWILPTLVRVTQFRTVRTLTFAWWRLMLDRRLQHTCQFRRLQLGKGRCVRLQHRFEQTIHALTFKRARKMKARKVQKWQLTHDIDLHAIFFIRIHGIPFVHRDHQRTPRLQNESGHVRILLRNILIGIQHQNRHIRVRNRLQGFDHGKFFNGFKHFSTFSQSGGINQHKLLPIAFKINLNRIARRTRHVERNHALFTDQRINQRGFTHIRATHHRDFNRLQTAVFGNGLVFIRLYFLIRRSQQARNAVIVQMRERIIAR